MRAPLAETLTFAQSVADHLWPPWRATPADAGSRSPGRYPLTQDKHNIILVL